MRKAGISYSKIAYMTNLAEKVREDKTFLTSLETLPDEEIIKQLTTIKGIGPWTAEMFLLFSLGREDIFSYGDLALINAIKKLYTPKDTKKETILAITEKWSPYRSYASKVLWKSLSL
jgi:DNA-3-methyladenine glycosylase II